MKAERIVFKRVEMRESEAEKLVDAIREIESCVGATTVPPDWTLKILTALRDKMESL